MARPYQPRTNEGGNFCGHDPNQPCFALANPAPTGKGGLPRVLTLLMERITGYFSNPQALPSLNLANGSQRQQRSERREACINVMAAIIRRTDLSSLRVGFPAPEGFVNFTFDLITKDTGLTTKRVERAVKDLKNAGMIAVAQPRRLTESGEYRGLAAVKTVSKHLFGAFGLVRMLAAERKKATKRLKKRAESQQPPRTLTDMSRFSLFMGGLGQGVKKPKQQSRSKTQEGPTDEEERRRWTQCCVDIKTTNPTWAKEKVYTEADRLLQGMMIA